MRLQKAVILFFLFASFAFSQTKRSNLVFLKIDPSRCEDCAISINGKHAGNTDDRGRFVLKYDTSRTEKFEIDVKDDIEKISKRFTIVLGKDQKNPENKIVFINILGAYLNFDEAKKNLEETLDNFKDAGVTDVFIPVFANGKTLYPSKVAGIQSSDKDYLKEIVAKCEKLNLRAHATISTLNWGVENSVKLESKDFLMVNKKGEYNNGEEGKYQFVSPAHPEVIRILTGITEEVAANYPNLYSINFDYLRFKKGSYKKIDQEDFGFEKNSVELFKNIYNLDPYKIKFDTALGSNWLKWIEFKENLITNLFVKLVSEVKDTNSNLKITMNLDPAYLSKRGLNLTCANAYEIEQFIYPDHYFLEISKNDLIDEMRMLDQYMSSDNPFEDRQAIIRRKEAFITLIKDEGPISEAEFNKMVDIIHKKEQGFNFLIYDQSIFKSSQNREKLIRITTD